MAERRPRRRTQAGRHSRRGRGKSAIVLGVGLNVTLRPDEIGEPNATSLLDLGVEQLDRTALVRRLLEELGRRVNQWRTADPQLIGDYRSRSRTIGSPVRATLPGGGEIVGTARSVDDAGWLSIETDHGEAVAVSAGDVVHLR
jgi:BirA family transcriptional regulator, biotin operon repressor / biotin---[acetyl-CoA-carboxylase] ligase